MRNWTLDMGRMLHDYFLLFTPGKMNRKLQIRMFRIIEIIFHLNFFFGQRKSLAKRRNNYDAERLPEIDQLFCRYVIEEKIVLFSNYI